jgi:hypothetical protein
MSFNIQTVYERFLLESSWIKDRYIKSLSELKAHGFRMKCHQLENEMCIIRLHDAWVRFCRDLIFTSALGGKTIGGVVVDAAPGVNCFSDIEKTRLATYGKKPPKYPPKWGSASLAIDAAQRLGVKNFITIQAALGSTGSPANELRIVRNFYAHRDISTVCEIKKLPWYANNLKFIPQDIPGHVVTGGVSRFEQWVDDLQLIALVAAS